jgi:hypothetical protein
MIDFGGSYTDGWVEPELCETVEGDDQGLQKIVSALEDPDANTFDPSEGSHAVKSEEDSHHKGNSGSEKEVAGSPSRKRRREEVSEEKETPVPKMKKHSACGGRSGIVKP